MAPLDIAQKFNPIRQALENKREALLTSCCSVREETWKAHVQKACRRIKQAAEPVARALPRVHDRFALQHAGCVLPQAATNGEVCAARAEKVCAMRVVKRVAGVRTR